jgi:hypothetical protein
MSSSEPNAGTPCSAPTVRARDRSLSATATSRISSMRWIASK